MNPNSTNNLIIKKRSSLDSKLRLPLIVCEIRTEIAMADLNIWSAKLYKKTKGAPPIIEITKDQIKGN